MTVSREKSLPRSRPAFAGIFLHNSRDTGFPASREAWTQAADTSSWISAEQQDAAAALGISERKLWSLTQSGDVPHVKLDRITLYPVAALEDWLARRADKDKEVTR